MLPLLQAVKNILPEYRRDVYSKFKGYSGSYRINSHFLDAICICHRRLMSEQSLWLQLQYADFFMFSVSTVPLDSSRPFIERMKELSHLSLHYVGEMSNGGRFYIFLSSEVREIIEEK